MVNADFSRRCKLFQGKNYRLFAGEGTDFLRGQAIDYFGGGGGGGSRLSGGGGGGGVFQGDGQRIFLGGGGEATDFQGGGAGRGFFKETADVRLLLGRCRYFNRAGYRLFLGGGGATDFQGEDYRLLQRGQYRFFQGGNLQTFSCRRGKESYMLCWGGGIHVHRRGKLQTFSGGRSRNEHTEIFILLNKIS